MKFQDFFWGEDSERGGRWEGVAPRGIVGRPAGHNHRPSSGAWCHKQNSSFQRRMRRGANELRRCKGRLRVNSRSRGAAGEGREGPGPGRAAGSPLGGSASWSATGWGFTPGPWCSGWPAHSPTSPCCFWLQAGQEGVLLRVGPWGKRCDSRGLTRTPNQPSGFRELGLRQLTVIFQV